MTNWRKNGTMHYLSTDFGQPVGFIILCADGWLVYLPENKNPAGVYDSLEAAKNRVEMELVDGGIDLLVGF